MAFRFERIPLIFIFDAPESKVGAFFERVVGGAGGVAIAGLGKVARAASILPAVQKLGEALKNKIIIPMLVNPTSITVNKTPTVNKTLTKRGILNQYWQAQPDKLTIQGRAAGQRAFLILSQLEALMNTTETGTRNLVTLVYKFGGVYKGYFENFRITGDGMKPGIFDYSFDFQFADRRHFQLFLYAIQPSTLNRAVQNPGEFITETIKMGASQLASTAGISLGRGP